MSDDTTPSQASELLRGAWDELINQLGSARDALESPDLHAPPPDARGLAEGYRYLLGFVYGSFERAFFGDPDFPYFRRAISPFDKSTIDNADAMYLDARIDGTQTYRIHGRARDHRHWSGGAPAESGSIAPQYVILEAMGSYPGDSGQLSELFGSERFVTSSLDTSSLQVDDDGRFEIRLGPERPEGHDGNFMLTTRGSLADGDLQVSEHVILRVLFHDWAREVPLDVHIAKIGNEGLAPAPVDPESVAKALAQTGTLVENQMKFWNEFYDVLLESHGDRNGDGETFMPRNGFNEPNVASMATGGGQSTNVYAGGVFELDPDEALVIEVQTPVAPAFSGFHLANFWGESLDYANRVTSLNITQAHIDDDGRARYVVAHTDPGVPNWLDTTGLREGFQTIRWSYTGQPPEELPTITATKVLAAEVSSHMPAGTPVVTPDQRRAQIQVRQQHVQRRFRQH